MFKFIGILVGIMMVALAGMALLIIEECIRDHIRYRKSRNKSQKGSGHTKTRENADDHHQVNVNNAYLARQNHTTAARMAQEAHNIAVRTRGLCTKKPATWPSKRMTWPSMIIKQQLTITISMLQRLILVAAILSLKRTI